jgi:DNA polymerase-3 subunit alpha
LYAPIHNHSEYSALDGLSTCREIAARCKEIGCECCGITDHGTVAGHLDFAKEMATLGLKPIFGCELYHGVKTTFGKNERDQAHFVAGAMTDEGLRNLWRLVDAASTNFRYVGRVNWEMLEKHKEGVFATSACISGLVSKGILAEGDLDALNRYLEIYRDNFYIEIHTYPGSRSGSPQSRTSADRTGARHPAHLRDRCSLRLTRSVRSS